MWKIKIAAVLIACMTAPCAAAADPVPANFVSAGVDRQAIEKLLETYTVAVSTKNKALFETLLLSKDIPFSDVRSATHDGGVEGDRNYEGFRSGVFEGPAFTQRFRDVTILQDGALAQVSLVFENSAPDGRSWGWKTLQLLKVSGKWKIASEFYTGHAG